MDGGIQDGKEINRDEWDGRDKPILGLGFRIGRG
jgi:hypothetical protein